MKPKLGRNCNTLGRIQNTLGRIRDTLGSKGQPLKSGARLAAKGRPPLWKDIKTRWVGGGGHGRARARTPHTLGRVYLSVPKCHGSVPKSVMDPSQNVAGVSKVLRIHPKVFLSIYPFLTSAFMKNIYNFSYVFQNCIEHRIVNIE